MVESLLPGDGLFIDIEVLTGHPLLAHRKGAAALQFLGSLFRCGLARELLPPMCMTSRQWLISCTARRLFGDD